jgi:hypothetical protein
MPSLVIKLLDNTSASDRCVLCGNWAEPRVGPELFVEGTTDAVCRNCGREHAAELAALLEALYHSHACSKSIFESPKLADVLSPTAKEVWQFIQQYAAGTDRVAIFDNRAIGTTMQIGSNGVANALAELRRLQYITEPTEKQKKALGPNAFIRTDTVVVLSKMPIPNG